MTDPTNDGALRELFTEERFMRRLARSLVTDASTADDLVQQAFLRALEAAPRGIRQPRAWLGQVIRRLAIERRRTDARRSNRERVAAKDEALASPEDLVSLEEQRHRLGMAVTELPEPYRGTILRHYRAGWTYGRIARQDGVKRDAVESRVRRAKAMLRTKLGATSNDGPQPWAMALVPLASGLGVPAKASTALGSPQLLLKAGLVATGLALGLLALVSILPTDGGANTETAVAAEPEPARATAPTAIPSTRSTRTKSQNAQREAAPAVAAMPGLARMSGRLIRSNGAPVSETSISLLTVEAETDFMQRARHGMWAAIGLDRIRVRTDERGAFTLEGVTPGARHALDLRAAGGREQLRILQRSAAPAEHVDLGTITVEPGLEWTGQVVTHSGQPVAGATVRVGDDLDMGLLTRLPLHRFDPEGGFTNGYAQATKGIVQGTDWEPWFDNLRVEFSATLKSRPTGPRSRIMLESPPWLDQLVANLPLPTATTDSEGRFRLTGLREGSPLVMVSCPTGEKKVWRIAIQPGKSRVLRLPAPVPFETRILDEDGRPIAGASVCATSAYRRVLCATRTTARWATTNSSGRARILGIDYFRQPTDQLTVAARRQAGTPWHFWPAAGGTQLTELRWPAPARFEYRVEVDAGAKFDPQYLELVQGPPLGDAIEFGIQPTLDLSKLMRRAGDDRYVVHSLVPGFYTLIYRAPDAMPIALGVPVRGTSTGETPVLRIQALRQYEVLVTDTNGRPVPGAMVRAQSTSPRPWDTERVSRMFRGTRAPPRELKVSEDTWSRLSPHANPSWRHMGRTNAKGHITTMLGAEPSRIVATHPQLGTGAVTTTEAGEANRTIRIQLTALAQITGVVLEHGRRPSKRYVLTLDPAPHQTEPTNDARRPMVTPMAANGTFQFPPVAPGQYHLALRPEDPTRTHFASTLAASFPGYASRWNKRHPLGRVQVETVSAKAGQQHHLKLETDPGTPPEGLAYVDVEGRVTIDGQAASGCVVRADEQIPWSSERERKIATHRETRTDARGYYRLRKLCPGRWKLSFEQDQVRVAADELTITTTPPVVAHDVARETGTLLVRVLDPSGQPAAQTKVGCRTSQGQIGTSAKTRADGTVVLRLAAGTYTAFLRGATGRQRDVIVTAGKATSTTIRAQPTTELLLRFGGKEFDGSFSLQREGDDFQTIYEREDPVTNIGTSEAGWYRVRFFSRKLRITPERFEVRTDRPRTEIALTVVERK